MGGSRYSMSPDLHSESPSSFLHPTFPSYIIYRKCEYLYNEMYKLLYDLYVFSAEETEIVDEDMGNSIYFPFTASSYAAFAMRAVMASPANISLNVPRR
jgi:hypothetical protein